MSSMSFRILILNPQVIGRVNTPHDPDFIREKTGKCPPGYTWDGGKCIPSEEAEGMHLDKLPRSRAIEILNVLTVKQFALAKRERNLSTEDAETLSRLKSLYPEDFKRLQCKVKTKYSKLCETGQIKKDNKGLPEAAH